MFIKLFKLNRRWNSGSDEFYLSEVLVNSSQIVYMSEDEDSASLMREGKIDLGLHNSVSFTKIRLSSREGTEEIVVAESPNVIERKILTKSTKRLLRD